MLGKFRILAVLFSAVFLVSCTPSTDQSNFFKAVKFGYAQHLNEMLERNHELVNVQDKDGRTGLHWAVVMKQKHLVPLLATGNNLEKPDNRGYYPIDYARFDQELISSLIALGAKQPADWAHQNIYRAIELGDLEALNAFIRKDPSIVTHRNESGDTPLMHAINRLQPRAAVLLANSGASISELDENGNPLMKEIARSKNRTLLETLIANGTDINTRDENGKTLLHYAVMNDERDIVAFLIASRACVSKTDNEGNTPLHFSRSEGITETMLINGADINTRNTRGETLLCLVVESLPEAGQVIKLENEVGTFRVSLISLKKKRTTAQKKAIDDAITKAAETDPYLEIDEKAIINQWAKSPSAKAIKLDEERLTAELTAREQELKILRDQITLKKEYLAYLLLKGAELNTADAGGISPLGIARKKGYPDVIDFLVRKGARG